MALHGIEWATKYTLTGPDGTIAVFNDETDPNYVGALTTESSGLDSADVRESSDDIPEGDGAVHGLFFEGRRPVVLTGAILASSLNDRHLKVDRLRRAAHALQGDAILTWTPTGGTPLMLRLRLQAAKRIVGGWVKAFQLPMVAADPRIYGANLSSVSVSAAGAVDAGREYDRSYDINYGVTPSVGQLLVQNIGDAPSPPIMRVYGPGVNPSIQNQSTGEVITLNYTLSAGEFLSIDPAAGEVLLNGLTNRYGAVDQANTQWWNLLPGTNDIRLRYYSFSAGAKLELDWRDAYL